MNKREELVKLIELATKSDTGWPRLAKTISAQILVDYFRNYPKSEKTALVSIDSASGIIRLMAGKKDVTPKGFEERIQQIAVEILLDNMEVSEAVNKNTARPKLSGELIMKFIFWGYNLFFGILLILFLLTLGDIPDSATGLLGELKEIDTVRQLALGVMFLAPILAVFWAVKRKNTELGKLFFIFEIPTVLISLTISEMAVRTIPAMWPPALAVMALPFVLYLETENSSDEKLLAGKLLINEMFLFITGYMTLLWSFFVPAIGMGWIKYLLELISGRYYGEVSIGSTLAILLTRLVPTLIGAVIISTPYIVTAILAKNWYRLVHQAIAKWGRVRMDAFLIVTTVTAITIMEFLSYQPRQGYVIRKLESFGRAYTFEEKEIVARELGKNQELVKKSIDEYLDLLESYPLTNDDNFLAQAYKNVGTSERASERIQSWFKMAAYPFVLRQSRSSINDLTVNYYSIFGSHYYSSSTDDAKISQDILKKQTIARIPSRINLDNRLINLTTEHDGVVAKVEITDEFTSNSSRSEEVIYEFSLPNEAAINELKLGPNLEFEGIIAPSGAATKTYQREVDKSRDPALLEQVGPRQYRLRVFPVPASTDVVTLGGKHQKVKFSYVVSGRAAGYALPVYSKLTNLDVSKVKISLSTENGKSTLKWSDQYVEVAGLGEKLCNLNKKITLADESGKKAELIPYGTDYKIDQEFLCNSETEPKLLMAETEAWGWPNIVFFYDVSMDNKNNPKIQQIKKFVKKHPELTINGNSIKLVKFNDRLSEETVVDSGNIDQVLDSLIYFGKGDMIKSVRGSKNLERFDVGIVIASDKTINTKTEGSGYAVDRTYVWHPDNIPSYNQNVTKWLAENGGGVVDSIEDAINNRIIDNVINRSDGANEQDLIIGDFWHLYRPESIGIGETMGNWGAKEDNFLGSMAARAELMSSLTYIWNRTVDFNEPEIIDTYHAYAEKNQVIFPYSSLIALVNENQLENLKNNSLLDNRYDVDETTISPPMEDIDVIRPQFEIFRSLDGGMNTSGMPNIGLKEFSTEMDAGRSGGNNSGSNFQPVALIIFVSSGALGMVSVIYLVKLLTRKKVQSA
ncbi:MAG: VIT domain-containing protein [Candidatus Shapirobacteria bacterium]|jgi:hypothetical protein